MTTGRAITPKSRREADSAAYRLAGTVLFASVAVILTALAFEHIGGYVPCPLCLQQRYAYYAAIPLLFAGLVLVSAEKPRAAAMVFLLVAIAYFANAGLGVYQAGAEWKFWPGPDSCSGDQGVTTQAGRLIDQLKAVQVVRCDEPSFRLFGLSFAGWNVIASFFLFIGALQAAFKAVAGPRT
ncbi:MAG: disulfide bond formation protein B [Hyphomicrobiaceae bacterium]|nr:disulfide bond formation protein B [Hyphomicrobiaceae bacterium]